MARIYFEGLGWVCPRCFRHLVLAKAVLEANNSLLIGSK